MPITTASSKPLPTPVSWTDNKIYLAACDFTERECNLGPGKPFLYIKALSTFLIECNGKYLLWNEVSDGIDQITEPKKIEDIFRALPECTTFKLPDWSKIEMVSMDVTWA